VRRRRLGAAVVVITALVVLPVGPVPPAHAAAVCTANVEFNYAPGITVVPGPPVVATGTIVLTCPVLGPDGGMWTLLFATPVLPESCVAAASGVVPILPGSTGPPGAVLGTFTYFHHFGGAFGLLGTVTWPGNTRTLVVAGEWVPVLIPGDCVLTPVTKGVATGVGGIAP
jgi:hypothetical protein